MPPISLSLEPFSGTFGANEASHLVRRTTFVFNQEARNQVLGQGLSASVEQLLTVEAMPSPPLNFGFLDLLVPIGQTWVNALYLDATSVQRRSSLNSWTMELMVSSGLNIREKMTLFWHNHFPIGDLRDANFIYTYSNTLRQHALGNFKELTKAITIDPAMLRYLNGNSNTRNSPNENYARELLELFTIGKGPLAAPGDYTNYTEQDIQEIAKVLTGWRDRGYRGAQLQLPSKIFVLNRHDTSTKQLSHRFDNAIIANGGANEYEQLIDILFLQDEIARHICRKLYRWFVYYEITPDIDSNVIETMAQTFIDNNYDVIPVLRQLLNSEHFFDSELMGCQIKNPYEFLLPLFTTLGAAIPARLDNRYRFYGSVYFGGGLLDMVYYELPQVAGWKAYYQEPVYYRYWINNVTLGIRKIVIDLVLVNGIEAGSEIVKPELLEFIETLSDPSDPNKLITESAFLFFTHVISDEQRDFFKESLIPGLPDFEWTVEYNNYLADPTDDLLKLSIELKLTSLFSKMLNSPDFHLQ